MSKLMTMKPNQFGWKDDNYKMKLITMMIKRRQWQWKSELESKSESESELMQKKKWINDSKWIPVNESKWIWITR